MKIKIIILLLILGFVAKAQQITISGYVEDASTGERIIGAYVIDLISNTVTSTNNYGFYNLKIQGSAASVQATYVGSLSNIHSLKLKSDTIILININTINELSEVIVASEQYNRNYRAPLGISVIPIKTLTLVPALGEPDLLKSIQSQPGVKGGVEGSAGIFVRGGGSGENLFLLDDVPIYNVSHLYGFFSAFNSAAIKDIKILKGCFPAHYGGRASSVIDVRSLDGNNQKLSGTVSIGLISSQITLHGPLLNKKTTFLVSVRRSYFDVLASPLKKKGILNSEFPSYYFYDFNLRLAHTFTPNDRLFISLYNGKDQMQTEVVKIENNGEYESYSENKEEISGWGNTITSLRWNHVFGTDLFVNTTVAYSTYDYFTQIDYSSKNKGLGMDKALSKNYWANYKSDITDLIAKTDFDYAISNKQLLKFGVGNTYHSFNPGSNTYRVADQELDVYSDTSYANEVLTASEPFVYIEDKFQINSKLSTEIGLRFTGLISDSTQHWNIEPRFSANYLLFPKMLIKTGYSRMNQYMHLLSTSGVSMPTDIWVPALKGLKPLQSDQINIGLTYHWAEKIFFTFEVYQKWMHHTTDMANGASIASDLTPWYNKVVQGSGNAKGFEFSAEKQQGKLKGMISYTLSSANRKFNDLNSGKQFPFKYDRLHDLSVSLNYQLSEKWDVSALWVFGSGFPMTLFTDKYLAALSILNHDKDINDIVYYYPTKNNYRLPIYHRLDLGIHYKNKNRFGEYTWSFDVFNAYNRKNPVYMYYSNNIPKGLKYGSFLPIIPSATYTLKF